jgi:hypothetical protein
MAELEGSILVLTFSRAELLHELLESISNLKNRKDVKLIVVRQTGYEEVGKVIEKWRNNIEVLLEIDGVGNSIPENIGRNRLSGYAVAFDALGSDWVLAVEEDVLLAEDSLLFTKFIVDKFNKKRNFRGINLGSRLPVSDIGKNSYCKTRYGVYGQGAVMTRKTWSRMQAWKVIEYSRFGHWDAAMESYMKTGLSIAPNNSRYLDRGWTGTHTPSNPEDPYYLDISNSYVGSIPLASLPNYKQADIGYWWRSDLREFKLWESLYFWCIFILRHPLSIRIYRKIRNLKQKTSEKVRFW